MRFIIGCAIDDLEFRLAFDTAPGLTRQFFVAYVAGKKILRISEATSFYRVLNTDLIWDIVSSINS